MACLVIGGLAALGGAIGIGALVCSGGRGPSSNQSTSNSNQNLTNNSSQSGMPLQRPNTFDYNCPRIFRNNYINNDSSSYSTNYSSYGGNYSQNYSMHHQYNNPLNNNHYVQQSNRIKRLEIKPYNNLPYGYNRSPIKKLNNNNINKIYGFGLRNIKNRNYLSPPKYINNNFHLYNPNFDDNEVKNIIWGKFLGKGGFGEVCEITYNGQKFAGKKLPKSMFISEKMKTALQREISILKKMNACENSVKFYKHLTDEKNHILILELCDTDLEHFICNKNGGLDEYTIYSIMSQLNNAFKIFYKENIIHRDIKPNNILIKYKDIYKRDIIPKINDYGLSRICKIASTNKIGTYIYMAPEVSLGVKYGQKADLWSLGVMMYYMHFKEFPFGYDYNINTLYNKRKKKTCQNIQLDDLLNKLLVYNPENRLSWPEYFNHPFFIRH